MAGILAVLFILPGKGHPILGDYKYRRSFDILVWTRLLLSEYYLLSTLFRAEYFPFKEFVFWLAGLEYPGLI